MKWYYRLITGVVLILVVCIAFLPSFQTLKTFLVGAVSGLTASDAKSDPSKLLKPSSVIKGEKAMLYGGKLETWVSLDNSGRVLEVGVRVPMQSIEKAPVMDGMKMDHERMDRRILRFPSVVQAQTMLNHLDLYYAPMGHGPTRFSKAHYDLHFFSSSPAEVKKIDCSDATMIDQSRLPQGYQEGVVPFGQAKEVCVPEMGVHAVNVLQILGGKGAFEAELLIPHYAGEPISLEPMITREKLLKRQSFVVPMPVFSYWSNPRALPRFFEARFDAQTNAYDFVFADFQVLQP
jgi:hypothetical protein